MRLILYTVFLSLLISGCERTDEIILPVPSQKQTEDNSAKDPAETGEDEASGDSEDEASGDSQDKDEDDGQSDSGKTEDDNNVETGDEQQADNNDPGEEIAPNGTDAESYAYASFGNMPYRVLLPRNYDASKQYPLHIFLHGIKERGFDNERQLNVGGEYFKRDNVRSAYPAVIVFPQCPPSNYWFDNEILKELKDLVGALQNKYSIDQNEITVGGFSMGAYGTFALVAHNPGLFRSAVAISGDGDERLAGPMAKTKWRIFAGEKDKVVAPGKTMKMVSALKKAGAAVDFTLYPDADHGRTWIKAYAESDYFRWIFGH